MADPSDVPLLDWRHATVGDPAPCVLCGKPALLRDPDTRQPKHKVCAEALLARQNAPADARPRGVTTRSDMHARRAQRHDRKAA